VVSPIFDFCFFKLIVQWLLHDMSGHRKYGTASKKHELFCYTYLRTKCHLAVDINSMNLIVTYVLDPTIVSNTIEKWNYFLFYSAGIPRISSTH